MSQASSDASVARPFWEAAGEDRLVIQKCAHCLALRWPPLPGCPQCLEPGGDWVEVSTEGEILSFVVYHRSLSPAFDADVPYTVALVRIDGGPEIVGRVLEPSDAARVGVRVRGVFDPLDDGSKLLKWLVRG